MEQKLIEGLISRLDFEKNKVTIELESPENSKKLQEWFYNKKKVKLL